MDAIAEVYIEFQRNGAYLKCMATCAETGEEAIAVGLVNDPEGLERLAVLKLRNKLAARRPPRLGGGGIVV